MLHLGQFLPDHLKLLSDVPIALCTSAEFSDSLSGLGRRQHQTIPTAICLFLYKIDRVFDHFIFIDNDLSGLYLPDIVMAETATIMETDLEGLLEDLKDMG